MDENGIKELAEEKAKAILAAFPAAVMCQGEYGLCYSVIKRLRQEGVTVLHACSIRNVRIVDNEKTAIFDFVRFREYE